jgi:hypothetical protein
MSRGPGRAGFGNFCGVGGTRQHHHDLTGTGGTGVIIDHIRADEFGIGSTFVSFVNPSENFT